MRLDPASSFSSSASLRWTGGIWGAYGGLNIYLARRFALGPRVDVAVPFAGEHCSSSRFDDVCEKVSDLPEDFRRDHPVSWTVSATITFVFGDLSEAANPQGSLLEPDGQ
jgi:hypothetical protein